MNRSSQSLRTLRILLLLTVSFVVGLVAHEVIQLVTAEPVNAGQHVPAHLLIGLPTFHLFFLP